MVTSPPATRRKRELDPFMRTRICELKNTAKWSYSQIHEQYPDIPISTIKSTVRREKFRVNNQTAPRSGRPRKNRSEKTIKLTAAAGTKTKDNNDNPTYV
ncbi:hypothetical protein N7495_004421 [Penicillium taxi]|uniref:uncharacterized protein n=1 Tax=Penicillium taxi TaxID=168475 RepID=UPI00254587BE|nr:uncharacterized protein N7495_004421 [Penicillium taxi]KAJ5899677.1 hypothetical protein N7495_004421 [Penicillium taxi]